MKRMPVAVLAGLALAAAVSLAAAPDLAQLDIVLKTVPDGPIARVIGATIPASDFTDLYRSELRRQNALKGSPLNDRERVELGIQCLGSIIENEILYQSALKHKLTVSDADVAKGWENEVKLMQGQLAKNSNPPPTEAELLKRAGVNRKEAMHEVKKTQLIEKMRAEIAKEKHITVTNKEISDFFAANKGKTRRTDQMHLKQIFIRASQGRSTAGLPLDKAREKAEIALKSIQAGESFEAVAKKMSDGRERANGGDMGLVPVQMLPPFLVTAASKMRPGDVSGIIESKYGFHIIKLVESVAGADLTLKKATPEIKQILMAKKTDKAVREYCRKYMADPNAVQVYMDLDKTLELHPELKINGVG